MAYTLVADRISKRYGSKVALADASLTLGQGEILALLGPNGAGKTTLIKIIATLLTKDSGRLAIMGLDLDEYPVAARHNLGYVGQDTDRSAYARLSVRENLQFFGALRGLSDAETRRRIATLAGYFEVEALLDNLFMTLSGGQKQTVVIMRALLADPPVVLLDEPTKGLDPFVAQRIRAYLLSYVRAEGKSLLLTSHILSEVDALADQVALIQQGTVRLSGTPEQLKNALGVQSFIDIRRDSLPAPVADQLLGLHEVRRSDLGSSEAWLSLGLADTLLGTEVVMRILREQQVHPVLRHRALTLEDAFLYHLGAPATFDQ